MSSPLDSTDKRIVLVSIFFLVLLTTLALLFAPGRQGSSRGFPSSYSAGPDGAKAAYMLLGELGYRVERWTNPPEDLPKFPKGTLLIIAGPLIPSSNEEDELLKQFVAGGGHLLITGLTGAAMIEAKAVAPALAPRDEWQTFAAEVPSPLTLHAPEISMEAADRWIHLGAGQLRYYGSEQGATVTKMRMGEGEIIWWGADSPLTNYGITGASNLALFLNCMGSPATTRVLWDEYFHGVRPGLWHYMSHTPLPWALLQLLTLAAFVVITYARRSGAVRPLRPKSRLSPLEFIETVGALYQRKGAAAGALAIAYSRFRFLLARRLGILPTAPTSELIRSVGERAGWTIPGFAATLQQIEAAVKAQEISEPKALAWVGELYDFTHKLGLEG
jgi:hypothetical protein